MSLLTKGSPKTIDLSFGIAIIIISLAIAFVDLPIKNFALLPLVVEGITTVTGLLFAVDAVLLTRLYSDKAPSIQNIRASFYVIVLAVSSLLIGTAYLALLLDAQTLALKIALIIFNVSYVVAIVLAVHLMRDDLKKWISETRFKQIISPESKQRKKSSNNNKR